MPYNPIEDLLEDKFRKKVGWKGEYELFRAAEAQHSITHPKKQKTCDICVKISKNICRLIAEGEELVGLLKAQREELAKKGSI